MIPLSGAILGFINHISINQIFEKLCIRMDRRHSEERAEILGRLRSKLSRGAHETHFSMFFQSFTLKFGCLKGFCSAVKGSILVQTSNEETWIPWKKEKQSWTGRSSWQDKKRTQHKKILSSWHVAIRRLIECHCRPCDFFVISTHVFLTARSCPSVKINWWSNSKPYSPNPTE